MRKLLVKILHILDDTPAEYGQREEGQALVELALITPLLIILIAGLVEMGYLANNYLSLLDATRAGARRATVLQDALAPKEWDEFASYVPNDWLTGADSIYQMPYTSSDPSVQTIEENIRRRARPAIGNFRCDFGNVNDIRFYNEIACTVIASLGTMGLNNIDQVNRIAVDDIVVSAFALQALPRQVGAVTGILGTDPDNDPLPGLDARANRMVVVGRYPANANECDVRRASDGTLSVSPMELRDPFDFNNNGEWDVSAEDTTDPTPQNVNIHYQELHGMDVTGANVAEAEKQIGFSWFGNHRIAGTGCIGSEWSTRDIENYFNLPFYDMDGSGGLEADFRRDVLPKQGIVMVEMFWEHRLVLQFPIISPLYDILGDRQTLAVWAAFPLPSVEPFIVITS